MLDLTHVLSYFLAPFFEFTSSIVDVSSFVVLPVTYVRSLMFDRLQLNAVGLRSSRLPTANKYELDKARAGFKFRQYES